MLSNDSFLDHSTESAFFPVTAAAEAAGGEPSAKRAKIEGPQLSVTTAAALAALEGADMAAWGGHGLYPPLLAGLARQNFTTPTPIQEACLPPAIHGRRDIIGAAQTVHNPAHIFNTVLFVP